MPASSTQISGLVGGQMAMFHNQAIAAQNVSRTYGIGQVGGQMGQPMPNPFPAEPSPSYTHTAWSLGAGESGARTAGAVGMAIPAAASAISIGGAFIGGRAGWLDPFTGVARRFATGAGAGGMGFGATMSHIGTTFRTGGIRAGMGVVGGGLAAGAAAAIPYYLAGKAISAVGENIYAGAQDVQQVGQMAQQYMDPVWGQAGSRRGGQRGRGQIRNMVNVLRDIASEDVMQDMESLKRLMDQAGRSGMLTGVQDVGQFRRRFKSIVDKTKAVAKAMGTSLEEAMPLMQQMGQMGMWTAKDIMGTTTAIKAAGPEATPYMMNAMQMGAQQSLQMGGSARTGAVMGRELFRTMQAAERSGAISREQMFEFTGGATGAEGQRIAAQRMTGVMQQFGQTPMGQLMLAGLGETRKDREGRQVFTGRIDEERMQQFQRGEITVDELQKRGRQATQGREAAASFVFQRERLGQEMLATGGVGGMNEAIQRVIEHAAPNAGEFVRKQLTKTMLGISSRDAEMISKLAREQERIKDQQEREHERILRDQIQRLQERQFRSWEGVKDVLGQAYDEAVQPIRDFSADLATSIGDTSDRLINKVMGRTRTVAMGGKERVRLFRESMRQRADQAVAAAGEGPVGAPGGATAAGRPGGALIRPISAAEAGAPAAGQRWFMSGAVERFTAGGVTGLGAAMSALGGGFEGSRAQYAEMLGVRPETTVRAEDIGKVRGDGVVVGPSQQEGMMNIYSTRKIQTAMERARKRAEAPTLRNLLGKEADTQANRARISTIQAALRAVQLDPKRQEIIKGFRDTGQREEANRMLVEEVVKYSGADVQEAFKALGVDTTGRVEDNQRVRDIIKIAEKADEGVRGRYLLEEEKALEGLGQMTDERIRIEQEDNMDRMRKALSTRGHTGFMGWLTAGTTGEYVKGAELSDDELKDVTTKFSTDLATVVQLASEGNLNSEELQKLAKTNKFVRAASSGDASAKKLMDWISRAPSSALNEFIGGVGKGKGGLKEFLGLRMHRATKESLEQVRQVAKGQSASFSGVSADTKEELQKIGKDLSNVQDISQYEAAMGDVKALSTRLSRSDIQSLAKGQGGTFGRMAAAMARTEGIQAMTAEKFEGLKGRISRAMGMEDITTIMGEEDKEYLQQALEGGIDKGEAEELRKRFEKTISTGVGVTSKDKETINKDLMSQLSKYTQVNTAFVQVVGEALTKMSGYSPEKVREVMDNMSQNNL